MGTDPTFRDTLKSLNENDSRLSVIYADSFSDPHYRRHLVESDLTILDARSGPEIAVEYLRRSAEVRLIRPTIFLSLEGVSTFHTQVEVVNNISSLRDAIVRFTERDLRDHTLAESEKMYRDLFESSGDAVFIHEPGGRFIAVNKEACSSLGYTKEELLRLGPEDVDCPESAEKVEERTRDLLENGEIEFEALHRRKDGSCFPVEIKLRQFNYMGRPAIIADVRDITDRKLAQERLARANEKLQLLGAITRHDISNRLASMMGYIELSEEEGIPDVLREQYIAKVKDSLEAIEEQLRFTGDYQKTGTAQPVWTDIGETVEAVSQAFDFATIVVSPELRGMEVFADPMIDRVFWNLLDNAKRHGDRVRQVRFYSEKRGGALVLVVEDDGRGIPDDEKTRVFEPGYGKHTGMGLFLIREILAITGMSISETGTHGKGARFEIVIPGSVLRAASTTNRE